MTFGNILRNLIEDNDITQKQLAINLNIAPSTLGNYIQNSREPDFEMLKRIALYFNVSIDYLLNFSLLEKHDFLEDELLSNFRCLTTEQQQIFIEQEKVIVRYNNKKQSNLSNKEFK